MHISIINGPNLHNIGEREPHIYGNVNFLDYLNDLKTEFSTIDIDYFQFSDEGKIVELIHRKAKFVSGIILNAGAYTHTSVAIRDAIAAIEIPVVMVHISNVYAREYYRYNNIIAPECKGIITGFGLDSYKLALLSFLGACHK